MYNNTQLLSNKSSRKFDCFGHALAFAIDRRGIKRSVVAEKADNMDEGQLSKYLSGEKTPRAPNQLLLTNAVGVEVVKQVEGWELIDPLDSKNTEEKLNELEAQTNDQGIDYRAKAELVEYLQGRTKSLSQELSEISDKLGRLKGSISSDD